ncbi:hypothetical protein BVX93_00085, partial [bacterium B13(2017)]
MTKEDVKALLTSGDGVIETIVGGKKRKVSFNITFETEQREMVISTKSVIFLSLDQYARYNFLSTGFSLPDWDIRGDKIDLYEKARGLFNGDISLDDLAGSIQDGYFRMNRNTGEMNFKNSDSNLSEDWLECSWSYVKVSLQMEFGDRKVNVRVPVPYLFLHGAWCNFPNDGQSITITYWTTKGNSYKDEYGNVKFHDQTKAIPDDYFEGSEQWIEEQLRKGVQDVDWVKVDVTYKGLGGYLEDKGITKEHLMARNVAS